jgi:hypothetical protein
MLATLVLLAQVTLQLKQLVRLLVSLLHPMVRLLLMLM